jgi:hypothetical protein
VVTTTGRVACRGHHIAARHFREPDPAQTVARRHIAVPYVEHNEIHPAWSRSECAHNSNGFWPALLLRMQSAPAVSCALW